MMSNVTIFNANHTAHNLGNYILYLVQFLLQEDKWHHHHHQALLSTLYFSALVHMLLCQTGANAFPFLLKYGT